MKEDAKFNKKADYTPSELTIDSVSARNALCVAWGILAVLKIYTGNREGNPVKKDFTKEELKEWVQDRHSISDEEFDVVFDFIWFLGGMRRTTEFEDETKTKIKRRSYSFTE